MTPLIVPDLLWEGPLETVVLTNLNGANPVIPLVVAVDGAVALPSGGGSANSLLLAMVIRSTSKREFIFLQARFRGGGAAV